MSKMYGITIFLSIVVWAVISSYFKKGPIEDHQAAIFFYGAMFPLTIYSFWWNVANFRKVPLPSALENIRIPLAAIALGINSAYYHIRFANSQVQKLLQTPAVRNLWLGFEAVLTIALIIGIYRWGARHNPDQQDIAAQ